MNMQAGVGEGKGAVEERGGIEVRIVGSERGRSEQREGGSEDGWRRGGGEEARGRSVSAGEGAVATGWVDGFVRACVLGEAWEGENGGGRGVLRTREERGRREREEWKWWMADSRVGGTVERAAAEGLVEGDDGDGRTWLE
jgi:hypothetical protein